MFSKNHISTFFLSNLSFWVLCGFFICLLSSCTATNKPEIHREQAFRKRDIGEAYVLQGNYTAALKELLAAEKLNPHDPIIHNYLGIVYKKKEMPDLAITHFKKAVELNAGYSQARNNLGVAYLDKGELDSAITCFKDVLSDVLYVTPQYPLANIGRAYFKKKEFDFAENYYKKALEKQPNLIIALNGLGQTYMATGNYHQAIEIYKQAVKFNKRSAYFHFQLAKAYESIYEIDKAIDAYKRIIEISPDSSLAQTAQSAKSRLKSHY